MDDRPRPRPSPRTPALIGLYHDYRQRAGNALNRNVKRRRIAGMAPRLPAAGMPAAGVMEARKSFRRLQATRQIPILLGVGQDHRQKARAKIIIETIM